MDKFTTGIQIPNTTAVNARNPDSGYVRLYGKNGEVYARYPNGEEKQLTNVNSSSGLPEFEYVQSVSETTSNSTTPVQKLQLQTSNLPEGTYLVSWTLSWKTNRTNQNFTYNISVNSDVIHESVVRPVLVDMPSDAAGMRAIELLGNNTIEMTFNVSSTNTQATVSNSIITLWRVV